jgi:NAD(P)-dependent dehydrogenase (short-subunit alcohol dehydrogenase family)
MDVTKDEDVNEAVLYVKKQLGNNSNLKDRKLYFDFKIKSKSFSNLFSDFWALVNNAGIINFVPIEWGKQGIDIFKNHMEVNALGQVRVTKAFLPLLRRTEDSRIVNVESLSGITQLIRKIA